MLQISPYKTSYGVLSYVKKNLLVYLHVSDDMKTFTENLLWKNLCSGREIHVLCQKYELTNQDE